VKFVAKESFHIKRIVELLTMFVADLHYACLIIIRSG